MISRPLHVLHVTAPGELGGLESVVLALAVGQRDRGHRVLVSAAVEETGLPHAFLDQLQRDRVDVYHPPRGYVAEARALRALIRTRAVDLVHSHGYRSDVLVRAATAGLARPLVSTVHGYTGGRWKNRLYERIQRVVLRGFDAVVAVSAPLAEQLAQGGVPRDRVHLLPNAYHQLQAPLSREAARERLGVPADAIAIGWVGRLSSEKGADVAVRALAGLGDVDGRGYFLGDGPERGALERLSVVLGTQARVTWLGAVPGAGALTAAFDLFLLSSRTEGTPIVVLEAMAAGVPIVATVVGGVPALLGEDCGWLVPADDPEALAAAVRSVLANPAETLRRVNRARERVSGPLGAGPWLDRHDAIYRGLVR